MTKEQLNQSLTERAANFASQKSAFFRVTKAEFEQAKNYGIVLKVRGAWKFEGIKLSIVG